MNIELKRETLKIIEATREVGETTDRYVERAVKEFAKSRTEWADSSSERDQSVIFAAAMNIYRQRNRLYKDNWRRFGWRGCLFRLRERVERVWDGLWDAPVDGDSRALVDDLYDLINFAAFTIRAIREKNRDGEWWSD